MGLGEMRSYHIWTRFILESCMDHQGIFLVNLRPLQPLEGKLEEEHQPDPLDQLRKYFKVELGYGIFKNGIYGIEKNTLVSLYTF